METGIFKIVRFHKPAVIRGFNVKPGFIGVFARNLLVAVTSGWICDDGAVYVYTRKAAQWSGDWCWNTDIDAGGFANYGKTTYQYSEGGEYYASDAEPIPIQLCVIEDRRCDLRCRLALEECDAKLDAAFEEE